MNYFKQFVVLIASAFLLCESRAVEPNSCNSGISILPEINEDFLTGNFSKRCGQARRRRIACGTRHSTEMEENLLDSFNEALIDTQLKASHLRRDLIKMLEKKRIVCSDLIISNVSKCPALPSGQVAQLTPKLKRDATMTTLYIFFTTYNQHLMSNQHYCALVNENENPCCEQDKTRSTSGTLTENLIQFRNVFATVHSHALTLNCDFDIDSNYVESKSWRNVCSNETYEIINLLFCFENNFLKNFIETGL